MTAALSKPCPICGAPAVHAVRPFCSKRCAEIDLSRWLKGLYAIPGEEADDERRTEQGDGETPS